MFFVIFLALGYFIAVHYKEEHFTQIIHLGTVDEGGGGGGAAGVGELPVPVPGVPGVPGAGPQQGVQLLRPQLSHPHTLDITGGRGAGHPEAAGGHVDAHITGAAGQSRELTVPAITRPPHITLCLTVVTRPTQGHVTVAVAPGTVTVPRLLALGRVVVAFVVVLGEAIFRRGGGRVGVADTEFYINIPW